MYKSNKRSQILLTIIITVGWLGATSGQIQKCALVGEYCQYHWDCCSHTCMTYLYKCMRNDLIVYPNTYLTYESPRRTKEEILELNFGVNNYVRPNAAAKSTGLYNFLDTNEVSLNDKDLQFVEYRNPLDQPRTAEESTATKTKTTETPVFQTAFINKQNTITTIITTTAPPAECSEIGVKCYRNEECCTERCHGYLHQCVT